MDLIKRFFGQTQEKEEPESIEMDNPPSNELKANLLQKTIDNAFGIDDHTNYPNLLYVLKYRKSEPDYEMIEEILRVVPVLKSFVDQRIARVSMLDYAIYAKNVIAGNQKVGRDEDEIIEFLYKNVLAYPFFDTFIRNVCASIGWGMSQIEVILKPEGEKWAIDALKHRKPKYFKYGDGTEGTKNDNLLYYWTNNGWQKPKDERKFICTSFAETFDNHYGNGKFFESLIEVYELCQFRAWKMSFTEKMALGRTGIQEIEIKNEYSRKIPKKPDGSAYTYSDWKKLAQKIKGSVDYYMPLGYEVRTDYPDIQDASEHFLESEEAYYNRLAIIVFGQASTTATNQSKSSYAGKRVDIEREYELLRSDVKNLAVEAANKLAKTLIQINFGSEAAEWFEDNYTIWPDGVPAAFESEKEEGEE